MPETKLDKPNLAAIDAFFDRLTGPAISGPRPAPAVTLDEVAAKLMEYGKRVMSPPMALAVAEVAQFAEAHMVQAAAGRRLSRRG